MALNFSFFNSAFFFAPKKKSSVLFFFVEEKERQKECLNEIQCRAYNFLDFVFFHNSHRFSSRFCNTQMKECSIFSRFLILRIFFFFSVVFCFNLSSLSEVCYLVRVVFIFLCVNW
jgi:hypothetical protein